MENLRNGINFEVVTSRKVALKRIVKPDFREDLVSIHMIKSVLVMNRPIQVGFAILDRSKYLTYDLHYNPNSTLLFTDTDSLAYEVVGHDVYAGMGEIKDKFDFPKDHFLQSCDNMKIGWKFKDECKGQLMLRFVGLRPKLYSCDYERETHFDCKTGVEKEVDKPMDTSVTKIVLDNKVSAKGVKVNVAKKLSFDDYEYRLSSLLPKRLDISRIGSDLRKVFTYSTKKIGLSDFDTKRWACGDGMSTHAFGHWKTELNM